MHEAYVGMYDSRHLHSKDSHVTGMPCLPNNKCICYIHLCHYGYCIFTVICFKYFVQFLVLSYMDICIGSDAASSSIHRV